MRVAHSRYAANLVGKLGNRQSVWAKVAVAALLMLVLAVALSSPHYQAGLPTQHIAEGDSPKIGTGG